jgi:hypothetical protein
MNFIKRWKGNFPQMEFSWQAMGKGFEKKTCQVSLWDKK